MRIRNQVSFVTGLHQESSNTSKPQYFRRCTIDLIGREIGLGNMHSTFQAHNSNTYEGALLIPRSLK